MPGRTPSEAVENFLAPLRQVLSCVTQEVLFVSGGYYPSETPHALTLSNSPARLGRDRRYALRLIQHYRIVEDVVPRGPWTVQTVAYYYTIQEAHDPRREIFGYHWHPQGKSAVTYPHFHLYEGAGIDEHGVQQAHFPTGRVAVEDVLRLVIEEFAIEPLREDWNEVLTQRQSPFEH